MPGMMLYMIESGWVRIYSIGRTGQELTIKIFEKNEIFGELSLLDDNLHSVTSITLSPTVVWLLPKSDLKEFLDRFPGILHAFIHILVARVRLTTRHVEAMTFQDVQGRLAFMLLNLAKRHGQQTEDEIRIDIPLTQVDLATIVGATRESVNKALSYLRSQNLVKVDGTHFVVVDSTGLNKLIQERGR
jgi:CRP-like cAMP-binding protein